jgi:CBS domain containing-hemolysin-like protein
MILKDDILALLAEGNIDKKLGEIKMSIPFVENTEQLQKLLDKLVRDRKQVAIVNDQYGSVVGLVSLEDLFETLLGLEIVDETDTVEDLQRLARQQWESRTGSKAKKGQ